MPRERESDAGGPPPEPGALDLGDPELVVRYGGPPHAYLRRLRREAPVCWHPAPAQPRGILPVREGYWVLSKHADVVHVSRHPRIFSSARGSHLIGDMAEEDVAGMRTQLIGMDPPQHVKYRRLVQRGFTPRMVAKLEPRIRIYAREIVERVASRGACEFVEDLASELPLTLICELIGVPHEDRKKIFEWSNQLVGADDPEQQGGPDPRVFAVQMWTYSNELASRKRSAPDDTLMSTYVHSEVDGEKISTVEINHFFVLLAVAGNETTRNATSHFVRLLSEHPEALARLRADVDATAPRRDRGGAPLLAAGDVLPPHRHRGHRDPRHAHPRRRQDLSVVCVCEPRRGRVPQIPIASTSSASRTITWPSGSASTTASARTSRACSCAASCASC